MQRACSWVRLSIPSLSRRETSSSPAWPLPVAVCKEEETTEGEIQTIVGEREERRERDREGEGCVGT